MTGIFAEEQRKKRAEAEYKRLQPSLEGMDKKRRAAYDKLLHEIAFIGVTLEELRQIIAQEGPVGEYKNGENQYGQKPSAAVQTYDRLANTYAKLLAQLEKALPPVSEDDGAGQELLEFLKSGRRA